MQSRAMEHAAGRGRTRERRSRTLCTCRRVAHSQMCRARAKYAAERRAIGCAGIAQSRSDHGEAIAETVGRARQQCAAPRYSARH